MALQLDLNKSAQALQFSLEKVGIQKLPQIDLAFVLDVSGSFHDEHQSGITNTLLTRLVPWGMVFDPDKKLEVFTFSDSAPTAHYVGEVKPETVNRFIPRQIVRKVPGYGYGTDYSFVLEKVLEHFGWKQKTGLFGGLFGKKTDPKTQKKSLILFVTDGENADQERTIKVLMESQKRQDQVYFLFMGVSNNHSQFPFIDALGEKFPNVGFVPVNNVENWVQQSDETLNALLLNKELIDWIKA